MRTWRGSGGRTTRRLLALSLAILSLTAIPATPAKASLPEALCGISVHKPWAYWQQKGGTWIKTRTTVRCDRAVDHILVYAHLMRSDVDDESNKIEEASSKRVECFAASWCRSITQFNVADHPDKRWLWWNDGTGFVQDTQGFDYDIASSDFFAWPPP